MESQRNETDNYMVPFREGSLKRDTLELLAYMEAREYKFREAAEQVFNAVTNFAGVGMGLVVERDSLGKIKLRNPTGDALDKAINGSLNHRSIGYFIELILKSSDSAKQSARAIKRHAENYALKKDVFQWLELQPKFKSIEAAATAITRQQPIAHVTARDWYKEWKNLRSTSTP